MYWFRSDSLSSMLQLALLLASIAVGSWFIVHHAFRLRQRERLMSGLGIGIGLYVWSVNMLGHWLAPDAAFWGAAALVFGAGLLFTLRGSVKVEIRFTRGDWVQLALLVAGTLFFTLIARGLGIFDDRKNLSLISTMAAGDIPPHFYMNGDFLYSYHYGFQLFAAALMRVGHLYPWSAFDLAKGLIASVALLLAMLWAWRAGRYRWRAGLAFAALVLFVSGARWLLLLLPPSVVQWAGRDMTLWGSGAQSAGSLLQGLSSPWILEGGPPVAIPFAFVNGIIEPFVLYLQAGPRSLAMLLLFVLLILVRRERNNAAWLIMALLLATWGLAAEAEFALFVLGFGLTALLLRFWLKLPAWRKDLRWMLGAVILAGLLASVQGGTLTELVRSLFSSPGIAASTATGPDVGFGFRWPPALVSSHLGEMQLNRPGQVLVGLLELGPLVLLLPFVVWILTRRLRRGDVFISALAVSSLLGFFVPMLMSYSVDRDITRMTLYALFGWLIVCWPVGLAIWHTGRKGWRAGMAVAAAIAVFAGLIVSGPLMTAMAQPVFADEITPIDAAMTRQIWDRPAEGALVLDSSPWRAVALTGRLTRSSSSGYTTLEAWRELVANPELEAVIDAGYEYVYVDRYWQEAMPAQAWESLQRACVRRLAEATDNGANGSRMLLDLRACRAGAAR